MAGSLPLTVLVTAAVLLAASIVWAAGAAVVSIRLADDGGGGLRCRAGAESDQVVGMLSVHTATGKVWHHDWHGRFIAMTERTDTE